jgi:putative hydrolase of the HAD superfamily
MLPVCVVLDLDDTLILERDYAHSGFTAVGLWAQRRFKVDDFASRARLALDSGVRGNIFDSVLREYGLIPGADDISAMVRVYRRHNPKIALLPDAAAFLATHRGVVKLALISDGQCESQRRKVNALRLSGVMDVIVLTDVWGRQFWKPHPRAFYLVQSVVGASNMRYLYVADNPLKDFDAPAALNWHTVRVRRSLGLHARCEPSGRVKPDYEISDLTLLPAIVRAVSRSGRNEAMEAKEIWAACL